MNKNYRIPLLLFFSSAFLISSCKRQHLPDEFTPKPVELPEFQNAYGGSGNEEVFSIIQTSDNNFVLTGTTTTLSNGDKDLYLLKIDASGTLLWSKAIGGAAIDGGFDVIETPDKGYLAVGFSKSFNVSDGYEVYLVKTDADGNILWQKTFGGFDNDCAINIIFSKDNDGYILIGGTNGFLGQLGNEVYVAKINLNGDSIWTKTYIGPNGEIGKSICYDQSGNLMVLASSTYHNPADDLYLLNLNQNGDSIYTKFIGGNNLEVAGNIIPADAGNFITCNTTSSFGEPNGDVWLAKINSTGALIWDKTFGSNLPDQGNFVIKTSDNNLLIAGAKTDSTGMLKALLIKTDLAGNLIWQKTFGDSVNYIANKVIEISNAYVIAGTKQYASGASDAFVIKTKKQ